MADDEGMNSELDVAEAVDALENPSAQGPRKVENPIPGQQELGEFANLPAATGNGAPKQAPMSSVAQSSTNSASPDLGDFSALPAASAEQQGPPESVVAGTELYGIVKKPDGTYGIQSKDGKIRDLSENEKKAASYMAQGLRMAGPMAGAFLGGMTGSAGGPAGVAALGGTGAVIGGESVHPAASFLEKIAGETPQERGTLQRTLEATAPGLGEAMTSSFAKSGLQKVGNLIPTSEKELAEMIANLREKVAPHLSESEAKNMGLPEVMRGLNKKLGSEVGSAMDDLAPHLRKRQFDTNQLQSGMAKIETEYGKGLPKSLADTFSDIREQATPKTELGIGSRGHTYGELEELRTQAQNNANFDGTNRTVRQKAWGQFYNAVKEQQSSIVDQMANEAQDPNLKLRLQNAKQDFNENIGAIRDTIRKMAKDPTDAISTLIKGNDTKFVGDIWKALGENPEIQEKLRGQFLDKLLSKETLSNKAVSAKAIDTALNKIDPKIQDTLLGNKRADLQKLINYGRALRNENLSPVMRESLIGKAADVVTLGGWSKASDFLKYLFRSDVDPILKEMYLKRPADMIKSGYIPPTSASAGKFAAAAGAGTMIGQLQQGEQ